MREPPGPSWSTGRAAAGSRQPRDDRCIARLRLFVSRAAGGLRLHATAAPERGAGWDTCCHALQRAGGAGAEPRDQRAHADASSYEDLWGTRLAIEIGGTGVALDLRQWVNSGLMTFFFFVVGLEARREFDLGELRERRRFLLPLLAALGGMAVPVSIFLSLNAGRASAHGWGVAMSTDTAFALGLLALVGPRFPDRLRAFMLT